MERGVTPERRLPVFALALACAMPLLTGGVGPRDDFADRITAAHNRERTALGIPKLAWSAKLAEEAAAWARHLSRVGHLAHAEDAADDPDPAGENLWAGTRDSYGVEQMIGLWAGERAHFHPGRFPDGAGGVDAVGHYTQMIWRRTSAVGCAIAADGRDDYLVCRYRQGGNVIGERPY